jgi:GTP-binding protein LepA
VTDAKTPTNMVKGFEDVKPMVFAGIILLIPKIMKTKKLYGKLQLNDASLVFYQKVLLL